jgi:hypothetical protein
MPTAQAIELEAACLRLRAEVERVATEKQHLIEEQQHITNEHEILWSRQREIEDISNYRRKLHILRPGDLD